MLAKDDLLKKVLVLSGIVLLLFCYMPLVDAGKPQRIISLAPYLTEELYLLGVGERITGVTVFCNYPPQAREKEQIGAMLEPNIEKILSLSPDLVVATKEGNRPRAIRRLQDLGIKVAIFEHARDFSDICKDFIQLGKLVGKEKRAWEIVELVQRRVDLIQDTVKGSLKPKVFLEMGARPLVTISKGAFANEFIRLGGGINIARDAKMRYPRFSREEVLRQDPDVIILVTMGDVTEKEKGNWGRFKNLKAVKDNRIYIIDADIVCRPSPISFVEGLDQIARLLHPEAFKDQRE